MKWIKEMWDKTQDIIFMNLQCIAKGAKKKDADI